jgi:hypothetical protein
LALGVADVDLLLDSLTSKQISEWVAFYALEPFGNEWLQTGTLGAVIANAHRDPKTTPRAYEAKDFIPREEDPAKSSDELLAVARMMTAASKGKNDRTK